jgi:hypothetical protein
VYGDCGRYPLSIYSAKRVLKYWMRILEMPGYRYVKICYLMLKRFDELGYGNWVSKLRVNLCENGFGFIWEAQHVENKAYFLAQYVQRLKDQFLQKWNSECENSHKLSTFYVFKKDIEFEPYLNILQYRKFRKAYVCFRLSAHDLACERGRYQGINPEMRFCLHCKNIVENEYHFLLICPLYVELRRDFLPEKFCTLPTMNKFNVLMSSKNETVVRNLAMYIYHALNKRRTIVT